MIYKRIVKYEVGKETFETLNEKYELGLINEKEFIIKRDELKKTL